MKVTSESKVAQSCLTLSEPVDYSLPGSSVHGIFQARVLEWAATAFSDNTLLSVPQLVLLIPFYTLQKHSLCFRLSVKAYSSYHSALYLVVDQ